MPLYLASPSLPSLPVTLLGTKLCHTAHVQWAPPDPWSHCCCPGCCNYLHHCQCPQILTPSFFHQWSVVVHLPLQSTQPSSNSESSQASSNLRGTSSNQSLGDDTQESALREQVPREQGMQENLGRCLGQYSPLMAKEFTPKQPRNPGEKADHLQEGCLAYTKDRDFWHRVGYQACVPHPGRGNRISGSKEKQMDAAAESEIQP